MGAGAVVGAAAATAAIGGAAYLGARYGVGRNPSPLQRYTAGVRAGEASGAAGGNFGQRFVAGLKGAAFPSSVSPRPSGSFAPASERPPSSPPTSSSTGSVAARTAQAAQVATRAIKEGGSSSFGPTNLHDPEG